MADPIQGALVPRPLRPGQGTGEASDGSVTDEIDDAQPQDATVDPKVPSVIVQLGVEARAEYIRARQWLGLSDGPAERLGTVGRYRLEAELGRGGMGIVFRASDPELDRPVAIKLVQAVPFARYDKLRTRLLREAKVLAKLTHPNVVRIYDCGQHEGEVYLAMELVEGATLREWQRGQSQRSILDAYQQAARGLAAAHELGITHRDFKPDNALVASDGRVLVGDFGLAGVPAGDELRTEGSLTDGSPGEHVSATRSGALLGTPAYMAPEQLRGEVATALSDQFAFCVSLWEALTGQRPFEGEKREELLEEIERGRARGAEQVPRRLRGLLLRGLAVEPAARFERLQELAEALVPRRGWIMLWGGVTASLVCGVAVGMWLPRDEPPPPRPCTLPESVDGLAKLPQWSQVESTLLRAGLAPTYDRLLRQRESMRREADKLCRTSEYPRQEWLEIRVEFLRRTLETSAIDDAAKLQEAVEYLEHVRWSAPPPGWLAGTVVDHLQDSYTLRMHDDPEGALIEANKAVEDARGRELELALAHRWRGRVLIPLGRYDEAMAAYRESASQAEIASYDDARLEAELLAAEAAVMRLGDLDRARDSLGRAHGLLQRLDESWFSPRYADYHEILASVLKREGDFDAALSHQWCALVVRGWWGDVIDVGMGHVNLGTIYEWRAKGSDSELARINYEQALATLDKLELAPEWCEAAFNLGHWLVQYGDPDEWPRADTLLNQVRRGSKDAAPSALIDLVLLEIKRANGAAARHLAHELEAMLDEDARSKKPNISAERRLDAWQNIANAHALAEDLAGFEAARTTFESVAREVLAIGSLSPNAVDDQRATLDLLAAFDLEVTAPERAVELATSAHGYFSSLPEAQRDAVVQQIADAEGIIARHRPTTPPSHD